MGIAIIATWMGYTNDVWDPKKYGFESIVGHLGLVLSIGWGMIMLVGGIYCCHLNAVSARSGEEPNQEPPLDHRANGYQPLELGPETQPGGGTTVEQPADKRPD